MSSFRYLGAVVVAFMCVVASADEGSSGWYAGSAGQMVLPQGGSRMRRLGGGVARVGYYLAESLALEGEAAWLENVCGISSRAIWHLHGWTEFDMLFGYERFDPFLSAGARGWIHEGQIGPSAGLGAFYYLTDEWALRIDADCTLGLDTATETVYSLSAGVQIFF